MSYTMLMQQFRAARRVSTPLIAINTPDPAATMSVITKSLKEGTPVMVWDVVKGLKGGNPQGTAAVKLVGKDLLAQGNDIAMATTNPTETLAILAKAPQTSVIFFQSAHRFVANESVAQAIWNLRDDFKADQRTLVLLAPAIDLPADLAQDVLVIEEELPTEAELRDIVLEQHTAAGVEAASEESLAKAVDALRGLAAFPAEQVTAMALGRTGIDHAALWDRKRRTIEQTRGLGVDRESLRFADIGGLAAAKEFGRRVLTGGCAPRVIVRIDEIEKMLGGAGAQGVGDSSGVSQDQLGVILREMEDQGWTGLIAVGPPGSGKSAFSKAIGGEAGVPTLTLDLGAAKGSLVGDSEAAIRQAMKVIKAIAGDGAFFIATCNRLEALPPELRRRFRLGIWYFDLPTAEERKDIWAVCLAKYNLAKPNMQLPHDEGWTGAEIRNACDLAWRLGITPKEAAAYVVPIMVSDPEGVARLRRMASGRFLSAASPGVYTYNDEDAKKDFVGTAVGEEPEVGVVGVVVGVKGGKRKGSDDPVTPPPKRRITKDELN